MHVSVSIPIDTKALISCHLSQIVTSIITEMAIMTLPGFCCLAANFAGAFITVLQHSGIILVLCWHMCGVIVLDMLCDDFACIVVCCSCNPRVRLSTKPPDLPSFM